MITPLEDPPISSRHTEKNTAEPKKFPDNFYPWNEIGIECLPWP